MLEQIWLIPAITFTSFWLILFFGKRLPYAPHVGVAIACHAVLAASIGTLAPAFFALLWCFIRGPAFVCFITMRHHKRDYVEIPAQH